MSKEREYSFTKKNFDCIREMVSDHTGIYLSDAKQDMVYGRLSKRIRRLGLDSFEEYCRYLKSGHESELIEFINAITTNLTSFFRENHHFEYLKKTLIPSLMQSNLSTRKIRIWSAGCSTGEEPYSIAISLFESGIDLSSWDVKILATDLDSNVVEKASAGIYAEERISALDKKQKKRWFLKGKGSHSGYIRVAPELKSLITFKQLNLMHEWPFSGPIDIIFCRNVVIYFDKTTQKRLFDRYANLMSDNATLFIGHSETLFKVTDRFSSLGNTIYRKEK